MNTKEYIESGVLELYVSGLLPIEEMRDVELKACQNADIKAELDMLQSTLDRYVMKHAMIPNPKVKDKILKEINTASTTNNAATLSSSKKVYMNKLIKKQIRLRLFVRCHQKENITQCLPLPASFY